jgi:hypothetical protein
VYVFARIGKCQRRKQQPRTFGRLFSVEFTIFACPMKDIPHFPKVWVDSHICSSVVVLK